MKNVMPGCSSTVASEDGYEWLPRTFEDFQAELAAAVAACHGPDPLVLFRGQRKREWLLDTTFVRSCKELFGFSEERPWPLQLQDRWLLQSVMVDLLLMKYLCLVVPTPELQCLSDTQGIDPWFELMKFHQQHPDKDLLKHIRGSNLLDWTRCSDVALYFANLERTGEGALWICDAGATGKTLQVLLIRDILLMMAAADDEGRPPGCPLMFHPKCQLAQVRADNQQAIYFAQIDMRYEMEHIWRMAESEGNERIVLKVVLPAGTESEVAQYLGHKGITKDYLFSPDDPTLKVPC